MKLTGKQLREIIKSEVGRRRLVEAMTPAGMDEDDLARELMKRSRGRIRDRIKLQDLAADIAGEMGFLDDDFPDAIDHAVRAVLGEAVTPAGDTEDDLAQELVRQSQGRVRDRARLTAMAEKIAGEMGFLDDDWPDVVDYAVRTVLGEGTDSSSRASLTEVTVMQELDPADLIAFGDAWASLGDTVRQQVKEVLDLGPEADANPNAVELALERLQGFNETLDQTLQEWLDDHVGGGSGDMMGQGIPPSI